MSGGFRLTPDGKLHISENDVEAGCLAIAARRGWRKERLHAGTFRSYDSRRIITGAPKGTPDYILAHGRYPAFYLETKAPGRKLSPDQEFQIEIIRAHFHIAVAVIDSADAFVEWLDAHERGP